MKKPTDRLAWIRINHEQVQKLSNIELESTLPTRLKTERMIFCQQYRDIQTGETSWIPFPAHQEKIDL
jgi:hypothetical protein